MTGGRRLAALGLAAAVAAAAMAPAAARDRRLGAEVAKPTASGAPWSAAEVLRIERDLDGLLAAAPTLRGAHVGLLVLDTRDGNVVYARNPDDAFMPASTLKLLTGSVALVLLGPAFRFRTEALLDSSGSALFVRAGGDPLLRAADLATLAQAVHGAGVGALRGGVSIDTGAFDGQPYPPGWSWDDFPYDYAAPISAATVEENVVHLTIRPGAAVGAPARLTVAPAPFDRAFEPPIEGCPGTPAVEVLSAATTSERGGEDSLDLARTAGSCILVRGSIPLASPPQQLDAAVPDPPWYLRELTVHALSAAGVNVFDPSIVPGPADVAGFVAAVPAGSRVVWTHDGERLADLLADLWLPSDNLIAEVLLKALSVRGGSPPGTTERGAVAERIWLTSVGADSATVTLADGSGLSSYDRITPRALTAILQADWYGPYRDIVLDDLPLAGVRGTLATSFAGTLAERRTFAKTGSLNHTRGLAGYLATLHHGALTFAWSIDDWMGSNADLDALRARVLARLIGD